MAAKRRIEITVETERLLVVRRPGAPPSTEPIWRSVDPRIDATPDQPVAGQIQPPPIKNEKEGIE